MEKLIYDPMQMSGPRRSDSGAWGLQPLRSGPALFLLCCDADFESQLFGLCWRGCGNVELKPLSSRDPFSANFESYHLRCMHRLPGIAPEQHRMCISPDRLDSQAGSSDGAPRASLPPSLAELCDCAGLSSSLFLVGGWVARVGGRHRRPPHHPMRSFQQHSAT